MKTKFIKSLQKAHSGEIAAYLAYQGHWESLRDLRDRETVKWIQEEELDHVHQIEVMLYFLGASPSKRRDRVFSFIGRTFSKLCKVTGYFAPMLGALAIEQIGAANYKAMSRMAWRMGYFSFAEILRDMHKTELEHKEYFKSCVMGSGPGQKMALFRQNQKKGYKPFWPL